MAPETVVVLCLMAAVVAHRIRRMKRAVAAHPQAVNTGLQVISFLLSGRK